MIWNIVFVGKLIQLTNWLFVLLSFVWLDVKITDRDYRMWNCSRYVTWQNLRLAACGQNKRISKRWNEWMETAFKLQTFTGHRPALSCFLYSCMLKQTDGLCCCSLPLIWTLNLILLMRTTQRDTNHIQHTADCQHAVRQLHDKVHANNTSLWYSSQGLSSNL